MSTENINIWKVIKIVPENDSINSLFLEGKDEKLEKRSAGQYASIRMKKNDAWTDPHPFTISCAPESDYLQFTIKESGDFTSSITALKTGDEIKVAGPFGKFCEGIDIIDNILMIAGGVGITPFLSVLRHFKINNISNAVTLIWSNRTFDDIIAMEELKDLSGLLNLRIIFSMSGIEDADKHYDSSFPEIHYESGRISSDIFQKYSIIKSSNAYICGPPAMQDSVIKLLESYGIPEERIQTEHFGFTKKQ